MKSLIKYSIFACIAVLASCTEPIDIELNDEGFDRVVVDAWLTTDSVPFQVNLTKTTPYFTTETPPPVNGATVTISNGTNTVLLNEQGNTGVYSTPSNYIGEVGKTYTLSINDAENIYEASAPLNNIVLIDSVGIEANDDEPSIKHLTFYGQETPGLGNYYMWQTYVNGELATPLEDVWFETDEFVDGIYINGYVFNNVALQSGDTATLEMYSINKETYDFLLTLMLETQWRGGLFDAPPANITTNMSNGALGHFNVSGVDRKTIIVP